MTFIDILGFSEKVRMARTSRQLQTIADAVRLVQREFEAMPGGSSAEARELHRMHAKRVLAFSDCVVVCIGMKSPMTRHEGTFDPLMMQMCGLAYSQGTCALRGIFVRGGLELGWWWSRQKVLVSSALAAAYDIEQRRAIVPVLALGEEIYRYLKEHPHRNFYAPDFDSFERMFVPINNGDEKQLRFLNYIQICLESVGWIRSLSQRERYRRASGAARDRIVASGYRANVRDWLRQHSRAIRAARKKAQNEKVRSKYDWLAEYHNSACANFGSPSGSQV